MVTICGFLALAQATLATQDPVVPPETIPVRHMRASRMLDIVNQLMPSTSVVVADDERGVLYVRAGQEVTSEVRAFVTSFDVRPRRVRMRIETDAPIERESGSVETVVANNRTFRFVDATTSTEIAFAPRINDDGTVTVYVEATYQGSMMKLVARAAKDRPFSIRLGRAGGVILDTQAKPGEALQWPTIKVSATPVDEKER